MPWRILALISSRFSRSQRSCSSCVSSKRSSTSSTLLEPVAWSCFWILASNDGSRISMVMTSSLGQGYGKERGESIKSPEGLGRGIPLLAKRQGTREMGTRRDNCRWRAPVRELPLAAQLGKKKAALARRRFDPKVNLVSTPVGVQQGLPGIRRGVNQGLIRAILIHHINVPR